MQKYTDAQSPMPYTQRTTFMKSASHFAWIDFLRGISAIGIVLFHVRIELWVGWVAISTQPDSFSIFDRAAALLSIPLPFLRSAVMLFFLVSGFCIHYPYAGADRILELKSYSIRRFLRIYPPYLAVVGIGFLIEWFLTYYFSQEVSSKAKFLETIVLIQNYGSDAGQLYSNISLWSIPIEVELYLAYLLFYWISIRCGIKWSMFCSGIVSVGSLLVLLGHNLQNYNNNPAGYVGNFGIYWIIWCAGALLAQWTKRDQLPKWSSWLWIVMVLTFIIGMLVYFLKLYIGIQDLVWAGFYFTVMLWGLTHKDSLKFLNTRVGKVFLFLGLISYSLYLIHYPFFKLCGVIWVDMFGTKPANFFIPLGFSLLSIPIAYAFYLCVEAPSHRLARKLASQVDSRRHSLS